MLDDFRQKIKSKKLGSIATEIIDPERCEQMLRLIDKAYSEGLLLMLADPGPSSEETLRSSLGGGLGEVLACENYRQNCKDVQSHVECDIEINLVEEREQGVQYKPGCQSKGDAIPCPALLLVEWIPGEVGYKNSLAGDRRCPNSIKPLLELYSSVTNGVRTPEGRIDLTVEQIKERRSAEDGHRNPEKRDDYSNRQ